MSIPVPPFSAYAWLPSGDLRGKAFAYLADTWNTLTTMARLIREATCATA